MRSLRRVVLVVLAFSFAVVGSLSAADPDPSTVWHDTTRDVYVDGRLDRAVQVLSRDRGKRLAVLLPNARKAILLDSESMSIASVPRKAFRFAADGASAELAPDARPTPAGSLTKVDAGNWLVTWKRRTVLVSRHQGLVGDVTEAALFEALPVWKRLTDSYAPAPDAVAALAAQKRDVTMTIVFGSWCGDSKELVPRVLKTLRAAANPRIRTKLVALDNDFLRPQDVIGGRRIINVPTILVDGHDAAELGRITETPAAETMEQDIAAILAGRPKEHEGRYERGAELARGTYVYRDETGRRGQERWTMFARKEGGRLVRSRVTFPSGQGGDLTVEVFQGTDAAGKLTFAEITKRQGESVTRARFFVNGDQLTGRLRGRETGILQQDIVLPRDFAFATPAIATSGWMGLAAASGATSQVVCYVAPSGFESPLGSTCVVTHRVAGSETVTTPAGDFQTTRLARQSGAESSDWWIHPELGIPVRGRVAGGLEYELSELQLAGGTGTARSPGEPGG